MKRWSRPVCHLRCTSSQMVRTVRDWGRLTLLSISGRTFLRYGCVPRDFLHLTNRSLPLGPNGRNEVEAQERFRSLRLFLTTAEVEEFLAADHLRHFLRGDACSLALLGTSA